MKLGARLKRSFRRSKSDSAAVAPLVDPGIRVQEADDEARNPPDAFEDALDLRSHSMNGTMIVDNGCRLDLPRWIVSLCGFLAPRRMPTV